MVGLSAAYPCLSSAITPSGTLVNDIHSQLNETRVREILEPQTLDDVLRALHRARASNQSICISGARHAMGGQAFSTDAILFDIRKLNHVLAFDPVQGLLEVEAGIQWPQLLSDLMIRQKGEARPWTFSQKQTGADYLTIGGSLSANIHGRGLSLPPFIHDIDSFKLINARGDLLRCSRTENTELFRLAIGGYGLFGFIYSVTLTLVRRRKVKRIVEIRDMEGLSNAFHQKIHEGYLYGDFQFSIDTPSDGFLRRGVFSCYKPVDDSAPLPQNQKSLLDHNWARLLTLAHTDKARAFQLYSDYYLSTHGQLYWSDEHQMSFYPDHYHAEIDRKTGSKVKCTEAITEIYCERQYLEPFMNEVREESRRNQTEIIYGTIRLIEKDQESFLAWAQKSYACVIFNLHVVHTLEGIQKATSSFRRLIDIGIKYGGSYYPTYNRYATREQLDVCYPQFSAFLKLKRQYDPTEIFQSTWYQHYRKMFA